MRRLVLLLSVACGTTADGVTQDAVPSLGDLKERVDQEPRNAAAVRALARLHLERGETDQALALATRLLDLSQDEPADRLLLARASLAESQRVAGQALGRGYVQSLLMDAEQSARLAARSEALRDEAELFLAHVLLRRDERSEALTLLSQLLERAPDLVDALALRGYLRLTGDTPVEALTDLERVLELAPDRDDVRKHRVLALSHRSLAEAE